MVMSPNMHVRNERGRQIQQDSTEEVVPEEGTLRSARSDRIRNRDAGQSRLTFLYSSFVCFSYSYFTSFLFFPVFYFLSFFVIFKKLFILFLFLFKVDFYLIL